MLPNAEVFLNDWSPCNNRHYMLHTRLSFFVDQPFQTHAPTQPIKKLFRTHYHPNPKQPNPRVNPTRGQLWVVFHSMDLRIGGPGARQPQASPSSRREISVRWRCQGENVRTPPSSCALLNEALCEILRGILRYRQGTPLLSPTYSFLPAHDANTAHTKIRASIETYNSTWI